MRENEKRCAFRGCPYPDNEHWHDRIREMHVPAICTADDPWCHPFIPSPVVRCQWRGCERPFDMAWHRKQEATHNPVRCPFTETFCHPFTPAQPKANEAQAGALFISLAGLDPIAIEIAQGVVARLHKGRVDHGPWQENEHKDFIRETKEELFDALVYLEREEIRRRKESA